MKKILTILLLASMASVVGAQSTVATGDTRVITEPTYPAVCSQVQATKYIVQTNTINNDPYNATCGSTGGTNGALGCTGGTSYEPSSTSGSFTSDESLDNTAVQNALNACPAGQSVELVPGASGQRAFVLAPWHLPSGVGITIDAGIHVYASRNLSDYGGTNCGVVTNSSSSCNHWITAPNTNGSGIYGLGVLDGRGWDTYIGQPTESFYSNRLLAYCQVHGGASHGSPTCPGTTSGSNSYGPNALDLVNANNFTIYKTTIKDAGNFFINWQSSSGFLGWDVKLIGPFEVSNTDGWDPLNSSNGTFTYGYISNGDNQMAVKATSGPASNITVSHTQTGAGIALAIGSATQYGVSNILVTDNVQNGNLYNDESAALQIGSSGANGGQVNQVSFVDDCIRNENDSVRLYTNYGGGSGSNTPVYQNVLLRNITVLPSTAPYTTGNSGKFTFQGLSGNPLGVQLDNISIQGTNQGISSQNGVATDQYANVYLGPGAVPSSLLTQFSSGTSVTTTGSAGTSTAYSCSNSSWKPLIGELNIKTSAANNTQGTLQSSTGPFTVQVVMQPATEVSEKESPAPTGSVQLLDNGVSIASAPLGGDGTYAWFAVNPTAGTHNYQAYYPGDTNYSAVTFGSATITAPSAYYVDSVGGSDSNDGLSTSTPWKTISQVNAFLTSNGSASLANVSILFKRGDTWHEQLQCISNLNAATGWTITSNPPMCSGSSLGQFTIGAYGLGSAPIIDGADPLTLTWTLVAGTTWQATVTGAMPCKLYVDGATSQTTQLLPVPNATGAYSSSTTYQPYDLVTDGDTYIRGCIPASSGVDPTSHNDYVWLDNTNSAAGNTSQAFSLTNSGLQNVEAIPGSWYGSGSTIYVNLADGSNPNNHTFEGTQRKYGVLLQSENHMTVRDLTIEHALYTGIVSEVWSDDKGSYFTGEYNQFVNNTIYNVGTITTDSLAGQEGPSHNYRLSGGIVVSSDLQYGPHLLRGNYIAGNKIGTIDSYFGQRDGYFSNYIAGIMAVGIDGGGATNNVVIANNSITPVNVACIVYDTAGLYTNSPPLLNNGGAVAGNSCTNAQGNFYFTATAGGLFTRNVAEYSYGEGLQIGGQSTSTASQPQVISYNVLAHIGVGASTAIYNGIDCNTSSTGFDGVWIDHNTIYDTNSASITLESTGSVGCTGAHVHNNIFDQNVTRWPQNDEINPSYSLYYTHGYGDSNPDFSNNLWVPGTNPEPWHSSVTQYATCAAFMSAWPDLNSVCGSDPQFVDVIHNNFHVQSSSPAKGAGTNGTDIGALPSQAAGPPLRLQGHIIVSGSISLQ